MVTNTNITNLIKSLEKFLIIHNNYQLNGANYEVIFIAPTNIFDGQRKYELVVSAKCLDNMNKGIHQLIFHFHKTLDKKTNEIIGGTNVCDTNEMLAQSLKNAYHLEQPISEVFNIPAPMRVENFYDYGILLRSFVLDKLILDNHLEIISSQYQSPIIGQLKAIDNHFNLLINTNKNDTILLNYDLISQINLVQITQPLT